MRLTPILLSIKNARHFALRRLPARTTRLRRAYLFFLPVGYGTPSWVTRIEHEEDTVTWVSLTTLCSMRL
jgi:hypothetical protein